MNNSHINHPIDTKREVVETDEFKSYYLNQDYEIYFIEYIGDIREAMANIDYAKVFITNRFFAILFVRKGMVDTLLENTPEIITIERNVLYTISELEISNQITTLGVVYEGTIPFDGEGVVVGIIGTGIDYLNPRFMTEGGESRIVSIWDETISIGPNSQIIPFGTEYSKDNINEAIKAVTLGRNPYEIVSHRDEVGYGTAIAGLIGGRSLDEPIKLKSIAPKCEFAIVKLEEARREYLESIGVDSNTKNVYQTTSISSALTYLSDLQARLKKPMVVYLPLGSNFGGRDGGTILESYIDSITNKSNFALVTNTGNQGRGYTHASGTIGATGGTEEVFLSIGAGQTSLAVGIYTKRPDIINLSIASPSGNTINRIPINEISQQNKYVTYQENGITIEYIVQEKPIGTISITMIIKNTTEGIWKISLFGESIVSGIYDLWIPQSELLKGDTRFLVPDPYTTLLTPCTALNIISTSYYNEIENSIVEASGKGFPRSGIIKPSVTSGGVNFLTVGLNNSLVMGSGAAMAGAILAGAVALVYQWGHVEGKYPRLNPPLLKNLIIAATVKDENIIYPNREWGYGKLSINKLYEVMVALDDNNGKDSIITNARAARTYIEDETTSYLYINIPFEIYKRI